MFRGLEVVEHACAMPSLMYVSSSLSQRRLSHDDRMGESLENISRNMDTVSIKQAIGVVGGICPFNFPAMYSLCFGKGFFEA